MRATATPGVVRAGLLAATLLVAALPAPAQDLTAPTRDTAPRLSVQTPYGLSSGGAQGSYYFQTTPGTAFNSYNATRGFTDLSVAQPLGIGRELGLGNVSGDARRARRRSAARQRLHAVLRSRAAISVSARASACRATQPVQFVMERRMAGRRIRCCSAIDRSTAAPTSPTRSRPTRVRNQRLRRQCRWPARPVLLVRRGVQADARLSRRRSLQEYAELRTSACRRRRTPTASTTDRWSVSRIQK